MTAASPPRSDAVDPKITPGGGPAQEDTRGTPVGSPDADSEGSDDSGTAATRTMKQTSKTPAERDNQQ